MTTRDTDSTFATVALIGWTNVGKSSLLNRLIDADVAAVSHVAQTTRHRILGVRTVPGRGQIAFVDTPGFHRPRHRMNRIMLETSRQALHDVDLVLHVLDATRDPGQGDSDIAELLEKASAQRVVVLNKVDLVSNKAELLPRMEKMAADWGTTDLFPVSALSGDGCDRLLDGLLTLAPAGDPHYPDDYMTDQTERQLVTEWIREPLISSLRQEVPHAMAVVVESWDRSDNGFLTIHAAIWVDRDSQKSIVIGAGGSRLKEVGTTARARIERELDARVHLELWVKVRERWRDDRTLLRELGIDGS
ncbi:MAG: GTPase Era [Acidobacteriota bacterium]|nr:GTPase Era [Acidobacteriota bacterium]MDH3786355.1 GTPase Era [Acidobacteriota bacterium]